MQVGSATRTRAAGRDVEFERELAGSAEPRGSVEAADDAAGDDRLQHLSAPIGAAPVHRDQVLFSATEASPRQGVRSHLVLSGLRAPLPSVDPGRAYDDGVRSRLWAAGAAVWTGVFIVLAYII